MVMASRIVTYKGVICYLWSILDGRMLFSEALRVRARWLGEQSLQQRNVDI